jgi:hypothetical protein
MGRIKKKMPQALTTGREERWKTRIIRTFTKKEIAEILKVDRDTVSAYHRIARKYLKDYRELSAPRQPLDPYQAWVLDQIAQLMRRCGSYRIVQRHLFNHKAQYSFANFERIQQND